jgi:hypothetical protein
VCELAALLGYGAFFSYGMWYSHHVAWHWFTEHPVRQVVLAFYGDSVITAPISMDGVISPAVTVYKSTDPIVSMLQLERTGPLQIPASLIGRNHPLRATSY